MRTGRSWVSARSDNDQLTVLRHETVDSCQVTLFGLLHRRTGTLGRVVYRTARQGRRGWVERRRGGVAVGHYGEGICRVDSNRAGSNDAAIGRRRNDGRSTRRGRGRRRRSDIRRGGSRGDPSRGRGRRSPGGSGGGCRWWRVGGGRSHPLRCRRGLRSGSGLDYLSTSRDENQVHLQSHHQTTMSIG